MHARMDQFPKAIKSRPSPDARRVSANADMETVIQALQVYSLTIWEGRNTVLHGQNHEADQIVHTQLNANIRRIYKINDAFAHLAKQYFNLLLERLLRRPARRHQRWLHLARQWSWNGTTNALHLLFIHTLIPPSPYNFNTNIGYANTSPTSKITVVLPTQTSSNNP
jgi:hypothetical protein